MQWDLGNPSDGTVSQAWTANVLTTLRQNTPAPYTAYQNYIDADLTSAEWISQVHIRTQ